ncbi:MAG: DinB family protein [Leptospira sp.]|uniref:DinB family protein n=1 Tax=Leptospira sp. TaxID=178 RepID=UPI0025B8415D|nr:DinB family protein [Leptospira sp.]MBL0954824.1 DinB family protein [Leptospira sp.]
MKDFFLRNNNYHLWATNLLYQSIEKLSDDDYKEDVGLFFKSIHGTLNHLLVVEKVWFSRLIGEVYLPTSLAEELETSKDILKEQLQIHIGNWNRWIQNFDDSNWQNVFRYKTMRGFEAELLYCDVVQHNMNHRTHHRGQITAAITHLSGVAPEIDYVYYLQSLGK